MATTGKHYAAETDERCPGPFTTVPPQPSESKPGQLSAEQVKHYFEKGYLLVEDYNFPKELLDACREAINEQVEELAQALYKAGKITKLYTETGLFQRLTLIEKEFPGANILLHKKGTLPPAFRKVWSWSPLLNLMEQLLGTSDIIGHPVWNLRTKTPQNEATTVPWHQEIAYLDNDSYRVLQPTAFIPLLDADESNGCIQVIPGAHATGTIIRHTACWGDTHYVTMDEQDLKNKLRYDVEKDKVTCPVPYGGMLLINNLIPCRSLNNLSDKVRWSLDFRWQKADAPVGFHGIKEGVRMRSSTDPNLQIDWDGFNNQGKDKKSPAKKTVDEFDTTIAGPWMTRWEVTHENRHVRRQREIDGQEISTTWH